MKHLLFLLLGFALLLGGCAQTRGTQRTSALSTTAASADASQTKKRRGSVNVSYDPAHPSTAPVTTMRLRTTAYIGKKNAISGYLRHGPVTSAASDWSKFPLGTRFRVRQTGKVYVIDDYGSALVGTQTLDLAKRNQREISQWGSRWVDVDILEWGSPRRSLEVLTPRKKVKYIRPMVHRLQQQADGVPSEFHRIDASKIKVKMPKPKTQQTRPHGAQGRSTPHPIR